MPLPPALAAVMVAFRPIFSNPVFERALVLAVGALLAARTRTVTAALRVTGRDETCFSAYHRVLSRLRWSSRSAARILLGLIVECFVPDGPIIIGLDETIERRWGPKIKARGIYRDPVRSCSQKLLQKVVGKGRTTVYQAISYLKEKQFIGIKSVGSSNVYHVNAAVVWHSHGDRLHFAELHAAVLLDPEENSSLKVKQERINVIEQMELPI